MKTVISILVSVLLFLPFAKGQNFEGTIVYQTSYKSKLPNVTDEAFTEMMGTMMDYNQKDGNYHSKTNGSFLHWQLYLRKDNKLYTKIAASPAILWNDGAENPDSVLKSELKKDAADILGYKCDELILTCKSGVQKYYFNPKLSVDPSLYENLKFGNFSAYLAKAKALPLKMVIENAQFTMEAVATSVEEKKLDKNMFALPPDAQLQKNPYN
jgi:hypothetical protein